MCEATCGLTLTIEGTRVTKARGDRDDVFSKGFICPKGASFGAADGDPDRLRTPLVREDGELREATWEEAFDAVAAGLRPVVEEHGPHAVGVVLGNPNVHTMAGALYPPVLLAGLRTHSLFTASTVDQMPKHVSSGLLYGDAVAIPVPDLDRTDHLLLLGANPLESNGSLCTAPDFPGKLKALKARGGTLTVVDPRRTRTAKLADRHVAIRPGTDALLLAAMAYVLFEERLVDLGELAPHVQGVDELADALRDFTPEAASPSCDVPADVIRELARELAAAPTAAVYGRIGSCTVPHGTLASWLVDVLNILTGNLDRPGGALFPLSATDKAPRPAGPGRGFALGRWHSRVSGHPEAKGELPLSALAEEIDTATGEGSPVRALIAVATNPVLSAPDGDRLDKALGSLDFMVSVDPYLNETSRHAHVVLPPPRPPRRRTSTSRSTPSPCTTRSATPAPPSPGTRPDGGDRDPRTARARRHGHARRRPRRRGRPGHRPDTGQGRHGPARARARPRPGRTRRRAHRGQRPRAAARHDAAPRPVRRRIRRPAGRAHPGEGARPPARHRPRAAHAAPAAAPEDTQRQGRAAARTHRRRPAEAARGAAGAVRGLVLIGRRHLRSNNSWLHNVPALTGGTNRCTLHIHPEDAERLGLTDGAPVRVRGAGGAVTAPVEVTDGIRRGVVSLPHGWGHDRPGTRMSHAALDPGVNVNQLLDGSLLDPLSGNAVLNGVPVELTRTS